MYGFKKILSIAFAATCLASGSFALMGQTKAKKGHIKHPVSVGFEYGRSFLFESHSSLTNKRLKTHITPNNSFTVRTPISKHFKAETGLCYNYFQNPSCFTKLPGSKNPLLKLPSISIPASIQYYPMPHHCRVQPYCGIGLQYTPSKSLNGNYTDGNEYQTENARSGTKYISIMFAQGVTFEINTKIQVSQSFHFLPDNNRTIGFGLGIGYTIE